MSTLAVTASQVSKAMKTRTLYTPGRSQTDKRTYLSATAKEVQLSIRRHTAVSDRNAEWQRVHSYIADVLKDTHVLYAKLARLEGDFGGEELSRLEKISEAVLTLGNGLSAFSKAFYEGKYDMAESDLAYGEQEESSPTPLEETPHVEAEFETEEGEGLEESEEPEEELEEQLEEVEHGEQEAQ